MFELRQINKNYQTNKGIVAALNNVNLTIERGEFVAVTGSSGSGKSTLLAILGCLDKPSTGELLLFGKPINAADDDWLANLRNRTIGFVFQQFNLIPRFNALENVELPMVYAGVEKSKRKRKAMIALKAVGLAERALHRPAELSGGQQQRVAIARSLVNNPEIIFADEPTGSLDENTSRDIMTVFKQLHSAGKTIVFVTHDKSLLDYATRIVALENGSIVHDTATSH